MPVVRTMYVHDYWLYVVFGYAVWYSGEGLGLRVACVRVCVCACLRYIHVYVQDVEEVVISGV